jgi:hypothetical protein
MQPSMEVRWFTAGVIPQEVEKWFEDGGLEPKIEKARTDSYLFLPGTLDVGIKTRGDNVGIKTPGDNVEIKRRLVDQVTEFRSGLSGRVEQWVKWSFRIDQNVSGPDLRVPQGAWIDVRKARRLRKYEIQGSNRAIEIAASGLPERGCNLELTQLQVQGAEWWSLGFESFGKIDDVEKDLRLTLTRVFEDVTVFPLNAEDSYGYPNWLNFAVTDRL